MTDPISIALFDRTLHDRRGFRCGVERVDRWLVQSVSDQIDQNRLRLWCATDEAGALVGFYGLRLHCVSPAEAPVLARRQERTPIPAVYLPALAVRVESQGRGHGRLLMADALIRALDLSRRIACAAVVLDLLEDAELERRRTFYAALGFRPLSQDAPNRLFLSMKAIAASLG